MGKRDWIKIISDSRYTKDVLIRKGSDRTKTKIFVKINAWNILNDIKKEANSITGINERLDFYFDEYDNFTNQFSNELALNKYSDITGVKKEFKLLIDSLKDRLKIQNENQIVKANEDIKQNVDTIRNDIKSQKTKEKEYLKKTEKLFIGHSESLNTKLNTIDENVNKLPEMVNAAIKESQSNLSSENNKENSIWERGDLKKLIEELINSEQFKKLNIETETTLKANQRNSILRIAMELTEKLFPGKQLNHNSFFSKLSREGYQDSNKYKIIKR